MPYSIRNDGPEDKPWCVYLSETDEKLGCTTSESEAEDMIAAIEANKEEKAVEVSYEERARRVRDAFWRTEYGVKEWVVETFDSYLITRNDENGYMYKHEYSEGEEGFEFEEGVQVEHSYEEKQVSLLNTVLDMVKKVWDKVKGEPAPEPPKNLFITKETDEGHRWVFVSSTALLDLENEIVARAAVEASLARAAETKVYGPLIFWHQPEISFGECDFQARDGLCLVESGLWDTSELAEAARKSLEADPEAWKPSIGFVPVKPPLENVAINGRVVSKVWEDIQIVERSIVSAEWAANQFATVHTKEVHEMDSVAEEALRNLVGDDLAEKVLEAVGDVNDKATSTNSVFKAVAAAIAEAGKPAEGGSEELPEGDETTPAGEVKSDEGGETPDDELQTAEGGEQKAVPAEALTLLQSAAEQLEGEQKAAIESVIAELAPPDPETVAKDADGVGAQILSVLEGLTGRLSSLEEKVDAVQTKQAQDAPRLSLYRASQGSDVGASDEQDLEQVVKAAPKHPAQVRKITKAAFKLK